jgi:hypothetical protein
LRFWLNRWLNWFWSRFRLRLWYWFWFKRWLNWLGRWLGARFWYWFGFWGRFNFKRGFKWG